MAGKVFLILGVLVTLGGVAMMGLGGSNVSDAGEWDVGENSEFSGMEGVSVYDFSGNDMLVMVRDNVRCDEFTFTMTNETEEDKIDQYCEEDGEKPESWQDDPSGWYHMATISGWSYDKGEYTINSSADYELVDMWSVVGDEVGEALSGIAGVLGGSVVACCGIFFLILGGIFALTMKTPQKNQVNMAPLGGSGFTTSTSTVSSFTKTTPSKQDELDNWGESES